MKLMPGTINKAKNLWLNRYSPGGERAIIILLNKHRTKLPSKFMFHGLVQLSDLMREVCLCSGGWLLKAQRGSVGGILIDRTFICMPSPHPQGSWPMWKRRTKGHLRARAEEDWSWIVSPGYYRMATLMNSQQRWLSANNKISKHSSMVWWKYLLGTINCW